MFKSIASLTILALAASPTFAQQPADPLCYWQLSDNTKISLESLCVQGKQPVNIRLTQNTGFTVSNVKVPRAKEFTTARLFYLTGSVTNNTNVVQEFTKVYYSTYRKSSGALKINDGGTAYINSNFLSPGNSSSFRSPLPFERPDVVVIHGIESSSSRVPLNICYAGSVETAELCKQLSPASIQRY